MKKSNLQNKKGKICKQALALFLCIVFTISGNIHELQFVQASENTRVLTKSIESMVCGTTAKLKPYGYYNPKFSSSNKKVATVTSKGVVKAVRLGVVKITASSGNRKFTCTITVKPEKKSDVRLNYQAVFENQKVQLKLASDKYDTSQVNLKFESGYSEISKTGKCKGVSGMGWGSVDYSYGTFHKSTILAVYSPNEILRSMFGDEWEPDKYSFEIDAGVNYPIRIESMITDKPEKPSVIRKEGISILLDGKNMPDTMNLTPGKHTVTIAAGDCKYTKSFTVSYSMKETLKRRDSTGWDAEYKEVIDAAFKAVDSVIKDGMTDEEKVKAIHDYLIYNADYVNDGNYQTAEKWAFGASGVLLHHEGVCGSYALAFYMMAEIAGVECDYVFGFVTSAPDVNHAWNRVKLNGRWYYLDATWDDPTGGGQERYLYYLSEEGWGDHIIISHMRLSARDKYEWTWYLTGD